jgi:hypothetical protein
MDSNNFNLRIGSETFRGYVKPRTIPNDIWVTFNVKWTNEKNPTMSGFFSYLLDLKDHGRYEKLQIFIILFVVVFHL